MLPARPAPIRRALRVRAVIAVAAAGVLASALLTGCHGSNDDASGSGTPQPGTSAVVVAPDAVIPESDGGGVAVPSPGATGGGSDCQDLQATWTGTNQALVNLSPDHPRALVNSFRVAADTMAGVEVPAAISDSWKTMAHYLDRVNAALENVDASDADAVASALSHTVSANDTKEATTAGERITAFVNAGCKG